MHVHLPKPLHGWRAFVGEVGIIVLGVLIALGAEQVAEHLRDKARLREAERGMVSELRDDDLPQAFVRVAIHNCLVDQLDKIEGAIENGDRAQVAQLESAYSPPARTWDEEAWKVALTSQTLIPAGAKRMTDWATAYILIPVLSADSLDEVNELPNLRAKLGGKGVLTSEQQDRLLQVTSTLRGKNYRMAGNSLGFISLAATAGIRLSAKAQSKMLTDARRQYGGCVQDPAGVTTNFAGQFTSVNLRR